MQQDRRLRLAPDPRSPGRARRALLADLTAAGCDDVADTVVLLASELCENAVLHAGTEFEIEWRIDPDQVVVTVSDRGAGPLELHLAQPRRRYGRAAAHGRGLLLLARLATAWGTRHERDGTHRTWFSVAPGTGDARTLAGLAALDDDSGRTSSMPRQTARSPSANRPRRTRCTGFCTCLPSSRGDSMRRSSSRSSSAGCARCSVPRRCRSTSTRATEQGCASSPARGPNRHCESADRAQSTVPAPTVVALPTTAPLRGRLTVRHAAAADVPADAVALAELVAHRVGMAVEAAWLREVDERRRSWLAYLADTSELLGQSLDVELTVAVVPQVVVPRLGAWCAVHLLDNVGRLRLAALTHADEERLPELRAAVEPGAAVAVELRNGLTELLAGGTGPVRFTAPTDGVAVPMTAHGVNRGTLSVGRPADRPHGPEDIALIADVARRAALAVHNAQITAAHVRVSQALQQALLPRALPSAPGLDLAAQYLPASTGSDVGGDFYDVYALGPARWLVAIGDVCGTGAGAAARTGLVRDVLRVLVREGRPLTRAIELLNATMLESGDPLQFATLAAALVTAREPTRDGSAPALDVELVLAGHLQPVLVRPGGRVALVGEHGTAVGLVEHLDLTQTSHTLESGEALLFYTDGVTERRRGDEQFGSERLLRASAVAAGSPADRLLAAVRTALTRFTADPHDDDIALLAVRAAPLG